MGKSRLFEADFQLWGRSLPFTIAIGHTLSNAVLSIQLRAVAG